MALLCAHSLTKDAIYLETTDGTSVTITKEQVIDFHLSQTPPRSKIVTLQWIRDSIEAALGSDLLDWTKVTIDADTTLGDLKTLIIEYP